MNGRNSYLVVGIFVAGGIFILLVSSFMFAGGKSNELTLRYTVFFHQDVSGLTLGAPVNYLGVGVGEVVGMNLVPNGRTHVRVDLEVSQSTPINSATYASLAFQGVTGVAYISLAADEVDQFVTLKAGELEYPVIPTRDVGLAALLADGPEITQKFSLLLDRANQILDQKNQSAITRTLDNIEEMSESIAGQKNAIASLPNQLTGIFDQANDTIGQLQSTINQTSPELLSSMVKINETTTYLTNISAQLDRWVTAHDEDIDQFVSSGLAEVPALIADTKATIRRLDKLVVELRKNPSQLVYKPQPEPVIVEP